MYLITHAHKILIEAKTHTTMSAAKTMSNLLQKASSKIPLHESKFSQPFLNIFNLEKVTNAADNSMLNSKFQQLQHEGYCVLDNVSSFYSSTHAHEKYRLKYRTNI